MASAFLSSILSKTSLVSASVRRWAASPSSSSDSRSSVLEDLKKLKRTLKRIHAVLNDAEEREIREESVKLWLKELKEVAYDAEDVLDECHYEELRAQVEGRASRKRKRVEGDDDEEVSGSLSTIVVSIPDGMGDGIREIRQKFDEISEDRERLRLREEDGERRVFGALCPPPSSHMVDESSIYGREGDKQKVIDLLFSEGMGINGISVIPIVGKGGLGKTTIAQLVYNDSKVKKYFDLIGWVCVSDDFNVPRLTKAIIKSLTPAKAIIESLTQTETPHDLTELSPLQIALKEKVKGKRVLLVLDDVWNEQQSLWESLSIPFVGEETVRIIVTCRNEKVVEIMQTVHSYRPGYLSPEQSWSLFRHYAFGGRDPVEQPRLADIGKQIVEKCSGLPLAVKTIGSLLRHEIDEDSWMEVLQSDLWELDKNNETLASLRLSYNRMPSHLKPCFVYCSMFPKDYGFDKDVLVRLWMAQGYIPPGGRKTMEDIGDECFNDLLRRSFFDSFYDGFYKMHDMIHDLAKFVAGNECYTIVDKKLPRSPDEVRHLYMEDARELVKPLDWYKFRALRTLLLWHGYRDPTEDHEIIKFPPLLRCLEFCWERKYETPDLLGNLKHLRYLHFQSVSIKRLPESVCLLYHLQTLILECDALAKLPSGLGSLTNLRHLDIRFTKIPYLTNGIRKLTNLQSLHTHCKVKERIGVLKHLVNLPTLFISGLRNVVNIEDAKDAGLKHKHKVQRLFLYWNAVNYRYGLDWHDDVDDTLLHLEAFPEEIKDVPANEKREEAMLEYLQPHTNLKKLLINGYGGSKFPEWVGNPFSFASLREIHIIGCQNVRSLPLYIHDSLGKLGTPIPKEPLLSMLKRVYISGCQQLTSIAGLHNLHSLKNLKICNCPQLQLLSEEGLPSKLQDLYIEECQQLTALLGMQNLTSLGALTIKNCPKLQIMAEDQLSYRPQIMDIVDCPGLVNWCQIQEINYIQVALGNKLTISNTWANIKHGFDHLTSTEHGFDELSASTDELLQPRSHLYFGNSWTFFEERPLSVLEELTIWSCMHIPPLEHLPKLTSLQRLVIKDCPGVRLLRDELLPSTLKSLVVDSCENLRCLQLVQQNRDALEELQIVNCPEIVMVQGLNRPFFPKLLTIEQCPQLLLSQDGWRPFIPPCAEIAGELEMKLYPPHSEETENKETIHDGTQEKQVLNCVMIENANSAVSSIFDAADDCNMGQFLQLGLPSGCSSQCPVQNNAEPSWTDNNAVSPIFDDATDCNMGQFLQLGLPFGCSSQSSVHNNVEPSGNDLGINS